MRNDVDQTLNWIATINEKSHLRLTQVTFQNCRNWQFEGGTLRHDTGRFFSIVGLRVRDKAAAESEQHFVMIDQSEVGWLGFLVQQGAGGIEWLMQAKTEPGNISATQLAPTLQATRSNYRRVHGGGATEFLDLFENGQSFLSDGPHSEQGTRFLWKFNRNSVLALPKSYELNIEGLENWEWVSAVVLRVLLGRDYTVNTDARSVIATGPWSLLAAQKLLFAAPILTSSYKNAVPPNQFQGLISRLHPAHQSNVPRWELTALDALTGWDMTDSALLDPEGNPSLRCFEIDVKGREVDNWCQPFVLQEGESDHVLFMRITPNGAEFFLRIYREVGFGGRREYGPSLHSLYDTPEAMEDWSNSKNVTELSCLRQSDEGGRFMAAAARYRIVLIKKIAPRIHYPFGVWVNLAVLERTVNSPGKTTNELRTLVSLVLSQSFDEACENLTVE